jgi:hydrogenase maturation protease
VTSDGAPGETRVYDREQILKYPPQSRTGPHDPALKEALLTVAAAGAGPEVVTLIGVIPEWVATGVALSPAVSDAVTTVVRNVIDELDRLGVAATPRPVPKSPHIWWEMVS